LALMRRSWTPKTRERIATFAHRIREGRGAASNGVRSSQAVSFAKLIQALLFLRIPKHNL
jgi:hypothetical protein